MDQDWQSFSQDPALQAQLVRAAQETPDTAYNISVAWTFPHSHSL